MKLIQKIAILLLFVAACSHRAGAQTSNYNLLELANSIAKDGHIGVEEQQRFLHPDEGATSAYVPKLYSALGEPGDTTLGQILDRLEGNPFIGRGGGQSLIWVLADAQTSLGVMSSWRGSNHSASSGFRVTTVADGIAKFLVSRAKEELSIAFFRDFKDQLTKDKRIGELFPSTTATLMLIDDQVYQFNRYLESLRESFIRDLKVLPTNLSSYLQSSDIIKNPTYLLLAEESLELSQLIVNGASTEEIIDFLAYNGPIQQPSKLALLPDSTRSQFTNMAAGFEVTGLISHSLYSAEGGYLSPFEVSEALKKPNVRLIYLGLLWQNSKNITFSNGKTFQEYLGQMATDLDAAERFFDLLKSFSKNYDKAQSQVKLNRESSKVPGETGYEPYYQFFTSLLELFETGVEVKRTIASIKGQKTMWEDTMFVGIRHLNDLNFDVRQKNYAASINDMMYVLRIFLPNMDNNVRQKIFNYGQFIASVASANNSDEVAAAIDAVALPPGSSRVKKQNYFSAAINAYTGGNVGEERLSNNTRSTVVGLTAPVGVTMSWMLPKMREKSRSPGSFSLFVPIIDVGALVTYRFNDPTTADLPDLSWSNLLAPGVFAVYGLGNDLPISVGFGAQRGPNLRSISATTTDVKVSGWRYGAFLAVDIPVFNLFVQGKKGDR
jgi:hypothetical protein